MTATPLEEISGMPKDSPLAAKVKKLREDLAAAEKELRDDYLRRRAELDDEMRELGIEGDGKPGRRKSRTITCSICARSARSARPR